MMVFETDYGVIKVPNRIAAKQKIKADGKPDKRSKAYKELKSWGRMAQLVAAYHWLILGETTDQIDKKILDRI